VGSAATDDIFGLLAGHHHEQISLFQEPSCGYRGIIAIHDTPWARRWGAPGSGSTAPPRTP
jgi:hypothetical protein